MKKLLFFLIAGICQLTVFNCFAQAPNAIPYQGVARNAAGNIISSQPVSLRISIHDGTATGTVVYKETHTASTTSLGLFSINIGAGTPVTGTLAGINWATGAKFLQVEMDPTAGTAYVDMGTTQLNSVPYALYAATGLQGPAGPQGPIGLTGATGATGSQGAQGIQGIQGTAGVLSSGAAAGNTPYWNGTSWVINSSNIYNNGANIGIGTTSPGSKLEVVGAIKATTTITAAGLSTAGIVTNTAAGLLGTTATVPVANGGTGSATQNFVDLTTAQTAGGTKTWSADAVFNGKLGIGTAAPAGILHTIASGAKTANYSGNLFTNIATSSTSSIIKSGVEIQSSGTWNGTSANNIGLYVSSVAGGTNNYDAIFNGGGNVGIGTTAPAAKLDVAGQVKITGGSPGAGKVLTSDAAGLASWTTPVTGGLGVGSAAGNTPYWNGTSWIVNSSNIFNNGGNVGIGTNSPAYKLDVAGTGKIFNTLIGSDGIEVNGAASGNRFALLDLHADDTYSDYSLRLLREPGANGNSYLDHRGTGTFIIRNYEASPMVFLTSSAERMRIDASGNISVGTSTAATGYKLTVAGKVMCTELKVQLQPFPDYVFEKSYNLRPLSEVEKHINTYKRLPGMPSACEVESEGMSVGEMQGKVVEKVEELTLYIIQQQKEIEALKLQLANLKK